MKPYRLCVLGNNSGRNAGDAAILASIVHNFLARRPDVAFEVPTIRPAWVRSAFAGLPVRPVSTLPWTGSLRLLGPTTLLSILRSDAVLVTDAIIFDYRLLNPVFNYLILLAALIPFARLCGKRVICFCVGVGPLDRPLGRRITRMICGLSDAVMVREESSRELLERIGVPPERLREIWADVAFVNPPAPLERGREILAAHGVAAGEPVLGVNVNAYLDAWLGSESSLDRAGFIDAVARGLDAVIGRCGVRVVFVITQVMDLGIAEEIRARMAHRGRVPLISNRELTNQEIMAVLAHTSLFAGMRLHSLILAAAMGVPVVPLAYAPKVRHFALTLDLPDTTFEFAGFSAERFADALAAAWEGREATRARLVPQVEAAKGRARAAFDAVVERFIAPGRGTGP